MTKPKIATCTAVKPIVVPIQQVANGFTLALLSFLIGACSTPYYGHSTAEWDSLSPVEQQVVKEDYQQVLDERNKQRHKEQIDRFQAKIIEQGLGVPKPLRRY